MHSKNKIKFEKIDLSVWNENKLLGPAKHSIQELYSFIHNSEVRSLRQLVYIKIKISNVSVEMECNCSLFISNAITVLLITLSLLDALVYTKIYETDC